MLRLRVTRSAVSVEGPDGVDRTPARVALAVEHGRVGIMGVGDDEARVRVQIAERPRAVARGLAGQILAAAAAREEQRPLRVLRAGEDAWWDDKWRNPYALRQGDVTRVREALLVEPLSEASWSPFLARALFYYALWTSRHTRGKTWPAFRRPALALVVDDDSLSGLHYEELVDELRDLWGESRIEVPRPVAPRPLTSLRVTHRASRIVFWLALAVAVVLGRPDGEPSLFGLGAAAIALVAIFVGRVAGARMQVELPRRGAALRRA